MILEHNPRIGLTGSRGVLGRSLQQFAPTCDWVPFLGNIRQISEVQDWINAIGNLDAILHLAAIVPTQQVDESPPEALRTNVEGTCNLLEAIRKSKVPSERPWLFISSSSHVYASSTQPLREDSPLDPATLYGLTKLQAEQWALAYQKAYDFPICIGRIFSYTSRWQSHSYFIPSMIHRISQAPHNAILEISGLSGSRDFLTTKQVSHAVMNLFEKRAQGVFNIGSGRPQSLLAIVHSIQHRLGRMDIQILSNPQPASHLTADVSKLAQNGVVLHPQIGELLDEALATHSTAVSVRGR